MLLLFVTFFVFNVFAASDRISDCGVGCPTCSLDGTCLSDCFKGFNADDGCSTCADGYVNYPYCTALCGNYIVDDGEECDGGDDCTDSCLCDTDNFYEYDSSQNSCIRNRSIYEITMNSVSGAAFLFCIIVLFIYTIYLTYSKKHRLLREDATSNTSNWTTTTSDSSSEAVHKRRGGRTGDKTTRTNTPPSIDLLTKSDRSTTSSMTDTDTGTSTDTSSDNTDRSTKRRHRAIFRQRGDVYTKIPERRYFSSTPSFPLELSKNTLLFGGSFEKLRVRVPYTDDFSIVNMRNSAWNFEIKEIKTPKYEILVDPIQGTIPPGSQVNIIAQIKLKCSCRVNTEIVVTIKHQEKLYTSNIDIRCDAQESEYIDGDEFDLDNATPSKTNIADNVDLALRTEIKFLQVLNEQQLASKYYGKVVSHKLSCVVLEYYPLGTLDHFLEQQVITPKLKRKMMLNIVNAISLLHSFHFVYRQLNPSSILVASTKLSQPPQVKLCGCSKVAKADTTNTLKMESSDPYNYYFDPVVFTANVKTDYPMDMFSIALIFSLLYYGEPITEVFKVSAHEMTQLHSTDDRIFSKEELPPSMNEEFANLICDLWHRDRAERPSITELLKRTKTVVLQN
ncbi:Protein kinase domain containing protein [Entamoeba marina]